MADDEGGGGAGMSEASIELFNQDCMEAMGRYEDNHFDLAVVDPPYGIKKHRSRGSKIYHDALWSQPTPESIYFDELRRVSKNQIIWGGNHLAKQINRSPCWIVWDKYNGGSLADCELAYTSFDSAVRKFDYQWNGILENGGPVKEPRIHPTQKPVNLYSWIFEKYAKPGQKIIDTHLGSGSSAIAAYYFGVDFVGCEIDPVYFADAKKRIEQQTKQVDLFQRAQ